MKLKFILCLFVGIILLTDETISQVKAWQDTLTIPTYQIGAAEVNPTFSWSASERKQRNAIYPYAFKEILTNDKIDKTYTACWLENEFIKVLILPDIGGRLHGAKDKTNNYNFFYWQPTIKPALIGMTGAWISGGIEWNFPRGHRPTAFSPVSYCIEDNPDGSKTVWVGETEWIYRMRWIVGITLYPDKSIIEAKVRLSNPTELRHSYWMWTTTAVNANENYQAIYPTRLMAGHGKFEYFHWPVHEDKDISWWKNIPNASSYFAMEPGGFLGGYDHNKNAGTVITGNKHIVIGKKLWTWGTSPFGRMWEPILTDGEGPYFEPQAGAYSDNQPDFHWIEPGEIKEYSHYFFPVRDIGPFKQANSNGALNLDFSDNSARLGIYSTADLSSAKIRLSKNNVLIFEKNIDIKPSKPFIEEITLIEPLGNIENYSLSLLNNKGKTLITYTPKKVKKLPLPKPTVVYPNPENIASTDSLWHAGDIIYKFRNSHRARNYFTEAIKKDAGDSRSHISLAELDIKESKYKLALQHLELASHRDPDNGKIFYLRGIAQEGLGNYDIAFSNYYRSIHFSRYLSQGYERIARINLRKGQYSEAVEHLNKAINSNSLSPQLRALKAVAHRRNNDLVAAKQAAQDAIKLDPLSPLALYELYQFHKNGNENLKNLRKKLSQIFIDDYHSYIELSLQYANSGLYTDACGVLVFAKENEVSNTALIDYYLGFYFLMRKDFDNAIKYFGLGIRQNVEYTFPFRREAIDVFKSAIKLNQDDGNAHYYLGLVYAGIAQLDSATLYWQKASILSPKNALVWRNLGLGSYLYFDSIVNLSKARDYYAKAFEIAKTDSRVLLEFDRIKRNLDEDQNERLVFLKKYRKIVESRDDLLTSMLDLMVQNGEYEEALEYYQSHHFHNWEGRYSIHNAYMEACIGLSKVAESAKKALKWYMRACEYPQNLEVAPREPNLRGFLYYPMSSLYKKIGNTDEANRLLRITAGESTILPTMANYYQARALIELGKSDSAAVILDDLFAEGQRRIEGDVTSYERKDKTLLKALGHYYVSKVLAQQNQDDDADYHLAMAKKLVPLIEREAIIMAQVQYAAAHQ
jgi:Flp pilus assembly protein TadD